MVRMARAMWTAGATTCLMLSARTPRAVAAQSACGPTVFCPGDSLDLKVQAQPPGTAFRFTPGVYRGQSIRPKTDQSFTGEPGVLMTGGAIVGGWQRRGDVWSVSYPKTHVPVRNGGRCEPDHPVCNEYEDLYVDDVLQRRVDAAIKVRPGSWYFDYATATLGTDPTGHRVEMTVSPYAFRGTGETGFPRHVTIRQLVVEKYAGGEKGNAGGAIWTERGSDGWLIDSVETRFNHFAGIRFASHAVVRHSFTHDNGFEGWNSYQSDSALIEESESARNNAAGYDCRWSCGGGKMVRTRWFVMRNAFVHDNHGTGVWMDIDNRWCVLEGNRVFGNDHQGIFYEISSDCLIRNNDVERNGAHRSDDLGGSGILVVSSQNVEIAGNRVLDNGNGIGIREDDHRGSGLYGPWTTKNIWVHDNVIRLNRPDALTGVGDLSHTGTIYAPGNVRFERNQYEGSGGAHFLTRTGRVTKCDGAGVWC